MTLAWAGEVGRGVSGQIAAWDDSTLTASPLTGAQQKMFSQTGAKLIAWPLLAGLLWLVLANGGGALNVSSQSAPVQLKNIAQAAGVHFVLNNSATPQKYQIEPMVAGVAVFDYNNDGLPDLYFVNVSKQ